MRMSYVTGGKHIGWSGNWMVTGHRVFICDWRHLDDMIRTEGLRGCCLAAAISGKR